MDFLTDSFMLKNDTARKLYAVAKDLPIIDYHCHLVPQMIAEDHRFENLGELLLGGDHYKWRFMRSFGIDEKYVTGDGSWREKFKAFAEALPWGIGNPLYHWTHLELKRYFGVEEPLTPESADRIYDHCTALLQQEGYTARGLIARSNVETVCTTDDPLDDLRWHRQIAASGFGTKVLPTFRPDKIVNVQKDTFLPYARQIGAADLEELKTFLRGRLDFFHDAGCRLSDHGLDAIPFAEGDADAAYRKALAGEKLTEEEIASYQTEMLCFFAREYTRLGWTMQIHVGATRNNSTRMYRLLGPDTGYDAINDRKLAESLSSLLNRMDMEDTLPKTILYSLNPNDLYTLATLMGCYQKAPFRSKLQLGSGWWFNDQRDGMEAQLRALGNLGVLGCFVGMLTDSRSFVSYPRHEYFRRILCNLLGKMVEEGEYPADEKMLEKIVRGICYENAKAYFGF